MDPIQYLLSLEQFGIKLGLENIRSLTRALDNPQKQFRTLIVAGTNGKGSVTAMVEAALLAAGYRAARYTSPHLVDLEERFVIDGAMVSTDAMRGAIESVRAAIKRLQATGEFAAPPTFFEATTAVAFELFRAAHVEVAVLEVGLGGRFDATNVTSPLAAAIPSIDFDHERHLGHTLREIAFEKAGVIKPGMAVVLGDRKPDVVEVFERTTLDRGARLVMAFEGVTANAELRDGRTLVDLATARHDYGRIPLALNGLHQVQNAVVAVRLLEELAVFDLRVPADAIVSGLTKTQWRARLELRPIDAGHRLIIDVAHNPAGARALSAYLAEVCPNGLPIVFGAMRDKDVSQMLAALASNATRFFFTAAQGPRAAPAEELAAITREVAPAVRCEIEADPHQAVSKALACTPTACVTGSIFLVGEILARLER